MIKFYNDTTTSWRLGKPTKSGAVRISAAVKTEDNFTNVSMLVPHEGLDEAIVKKTGMTAIETAYAGTSSVYYGKFDNMPNIGTNGTDKNIYFIAKDIRGHHIKDMTTQDIFIFHYTIKRGVLFMILSRKETCKKLEMTLHSKESKTDTKIVFDFGTDAVTSTTAKNTDGPGTFKLRSFRPNRPTTAIMIANEDMELLSPDIRNGEVAHVFYNFTKGDMDHASEIISTILSDGYTAVTLFTDLEDAINDDYGVYDDIVTCLRTGFNQINIMLGGRLPVKYIKR